MANTKKYTAEEQAIIKKQKAAIAKEEGRRKQERVANRPNYTTAERPPKTRVNPPRANMNATTDMDVSAPKVKRTTNVAKPSVTKPAKKSFRERRAERLQKRIASAKGEGRKGRLQKRLSRVEKRMAQGKAGGGMMKAKGKANGGMMKAKGMKAGGKFPDLTGDGKVTRKDVLKGRGVPGMKGGGMKTKGSMAGGKMKAKGYAVGGKMKAAGGKKGKQKVRGAGIARKGVRPAKMY